jgi:hypothetical protein
MKMARPAVEGIRPPDFKLRNHMLRQKPPNKQPKPSVMSENTKERPPKMAPVKKAATKKPP